MGFLFHFTLLINMFGFGNSTPEPPPPAPGMGMGGSEDKITMAYTFLAMSQCQQQVLNLQNCTERNGIREGDERAIQSKCNGEMQQLGGCLQSVDEEQVFGQLSSISAQQCPSQFRDFQSCIQANSSNPGACEAQFVRSMECAADHVISAIEQAQNQARSQGKGMW